jgi:hypothetical protein
LHRPDSYKLIPEPEPSREGLRRTTRSSAQNSFSSYFPAPQCGLRYAGFPGAWTAMKVELAEIPLAVSLAASNCPHNLGCLATGKCGDRVMCSVNFSFGNNVLMLDSNEQKPCPYRVSFGQTEICTCPVRQFLYDHRHGPFG